MAQHANPMPLRRPWVRGLILLAFMALLASAAPTAPAAAYAPDQATINWRPCYQKFDDFQPGPISFECAVVPVPLDHDGSDGGTIQLSVVRIPATDQENKIGSLFTNPGGPGGSDVEFTIFSAPFIYSPEIRAKFDIVGFDPRGVLLSTPARCYGNTRKVELAPMAYPITDTEIGTWLDADRAQQDACAQRNSRILDHMSTANVARDMDMIREAVGDDQLTYIGYSYGTVLGATYANMFPDRVRAVALDSALDPVTWTTGYGDGDTVPVTTRIGSHVGVQESLEHLFDHCDAAGPLCPLAPNSADRFDAVYQRLKADPLVIEDSFEDPETGEIITISFRISASDMMGEVIGILYAGDYWAEIAWFVSFLESMVSGPPVVPVPEAAVALAAFLNGDRDQAMHAIDQWGAWLSDPSGDRFDAAASYAKPIGPPRYVNWLEAFPGVLCADSDNPSDVGAWITAAEALDAAGFYGGPLWTWISSICAGWPGQDDDRYTGPWDVPTANPVLVITNRYDPATSYQSAVALDGHLGNSQLLVVADGRGHIAAQASDCAAFATEAYVLDLVLPPPGFECQPNQLQVFEDPGPPPVEIAESVTILGDDGVEITLDALFVDGALIQPVLIIPHPDGSVQVVAPAIVPLGTGEPVVVETLDGPVELVPYDIEDENGDPVTVQAVLYANADIIAVTPVGPPPPPTS